MLASSSDLTSDELELASAAEALERIRPALDGRLLLATDFDGTISRPVTHTVSKAINIGHAKRRHACTHAAMECAVEILCQCQGPHRCHPAEYAFGTAIWTACNQTCANDETRVRHMELPGHIGTR